MEFQQTSRRFWLAQRRGLLFGAITSCRSNPKTRRTVRLGLMFLYSLGGCRVGQCCAMVRRILPKKAAWRPFLGREQYPSTSKEFEKVTQHAREPTNATVRAHQLKGTSLQQAALINTAQTTPQACVPTAIHRRRMQGEQEASHKDQRSETIC